MTSLFRCPLCAAPLERREHSYACPGGHSFDIAREGYTHLLPANQKHSKNPGDDRAMVAARSAFLDRGYYAPLRDAMAGLAVRLLADSPSPALLDSGCGEGYYTAGLYHALSAAGHTPRAAGVDLSRSALKRAARRLPEGEFAVGSVYHLPLPDRAVQLLMNVFSPLAAEEFARVLAPGGFFLYVVPSARHLWEMKQVLYDRPYRNETKETPYEGFHYVTIARVRDRITLPCQEDIQALFGMTPYCWKTPWAGKERLAALDSLTTTAAFDIHIFERI